VAQGNGYGAGADPIASFQAVFTGSYTVANAGDAVITVYVDNTFIWHARRARHKRNH
jgi:hypothetical protein